MFQLMNLIYNIQYIDDRNNKFYGLFSFQLIVTYLFIKVVIDGWFSLRNAESADYLNPTCICILLDEDKDIKHAICTETMSTDSKIGLFVQMDTNLALNKSEQNLGGIRQYSCLSFTRIFVYFRTH